MLDLHKPATQADRDPTPEALEELRAKMKPEARARLRPDGLLDR
jgi:hypothetical protein